MIFTSYIEAFVWSTSLHQSFQSEILFLQDLRRGQTPWETTSMLPSATITSARGSRARTVVAVQGGADLIWRARGALQPEAGVDPLSLPWREAGPPNHPDAQVDSDQ